MKKEYKKVYDLVLSFGFSPAYIKKNKGLFYLEVFSKDYNLCGEGKRFNFISFDIESLKQQIQEILKGNIKNDTKIEVLK